MLSREQAWVTDVDAWLAWNEELLWLANAKAQAIKDWARATKEQARATDERVVSATIRTMEEYKDSDDIMNDAIKVKKDTTSLG